MNKIVFSSHNWLALKINNDCLKQHLPLMKGRVIDLGCGTSPYKEDILKLADEYIGVDWENSFHDQSNVDVFANLSGKLPFEDGYAYIITDLSGFPNTNLTNNYYQLKNTSRKSIRARMGPY